jgi:hypothetical protein
MRQRCLSYPTIAKFGQNFKRAKRWVRQRRPLGRSDDSERA